MAPFNFDVKNGNGKVQGSEEHKRSLLKSVHPIIGKAAPVGRKVSIEFYQDGTLITSEIVAQIHDPNGDVLTIPLKLSDPTRPEVLQEVVNQVCHYSHLLACWETHLRGAARAWNELEVLIK